MDLHRRRFLRFAAGAAIVPAMARAAQAYPTRPVRLVVGFPPAGVGDIIARLMGQWLSERLGQTVVVENRAGAGSTLAAETVVRSAPDGYTLLWVSSANPISTTFYPSAGFNLIRDIAPVSSIAEVPLVMEVNPSVPAKSLPEFIAYAKSRPGKVNWASGGNGTMNQLSGELFRSLTGTNMLHVPYRGTSLALTDLIGGQVEVMFDNLPSSIEYIRSGTLRALAVTTATRSPVLPDIPTIGEFVPGYETSTWVGIGVPARVPAPIVAALNNAINAGLADRQMIARLAELGGRPLGGSPADLGKLIAADTDKWARVIKATGAKPE